jgi:diguanylate cyclase (GGDEF)-like protein
MVYFILSWISVVVFAGGLINLSLAITALQKRTARESLYFALLMLAASIYSFGYGFEAMSVTVKEAAFFIRVEYLGVAWIPTFLILFSLRFSGSQFKHEIILLVALSVLSCLIIAAQWTNPLHHLYYVSASMKSLGLGMKTLSIERGPIFYLSATYHLTAMAIFFGVCAYRIGHSDGIFKQQALIILSGLSVGVIGFILYLTGIFGGLDITPMVLPLMGIILSVGRGRSGLFEVSPITVNSIFNAMREGCIILDRERRLVNFNAAAAAFFPSLIKKKLSEHCSEVGALPPEIFRLLNEPGLREIDIVDQDSMPPRCLKASISRMTDERNRIHGAALFFMDISNEWRAAENLRQFATHDHLTGLFSRRHFTELAERALAMTDRAGRPFSVIMMDLDFFKLINDKYGHKAGDSVLASIARVLSTSVRECDILSRFGGEEFLLALPEADAEAARLVAERIRQNVEKCPHLPEYPEERITISLGVATRSNPGEEDLESLVGKADAAL